jgi:sec-independent protein translocase protein TatC
VLYQIWAFIAPGLYKHEQTYAGAFVLFGSLFFVGGAAFCYFVVLPVGLPFLVGMNPPDVLGMYKVGEYYSFAIRLLLAFGVAFEMPIVVVLLALLGVVEPEQFVRFRKYALVLSFVIAAILTPPDVVSQIAMAAPLYLLFESGVLVARILVRRRKKHAQKSAEAEQEAMAGGDPETKPEQDSVATADGDANKPLAG